MKIVLIRPALSLDTQMAAHLVHMSMGRLADFLFSSGGKIKANTVLAKLVMQPRNRFSYQFADIAEVDGKTAGLLLSYPGWTMKHLEIPMGRQLVKIFGAVGFFRFLRKSIPLVFCREAENDEYFINNIAVLPDFQGEGIGSQLMKHAEEKAIAERFQKCSLVVEISNTRARNLYERFGYQVVNTTKFIQLDRLIGCKGFHRMVKELK